MFLEFCNYNSSSATTSEHQVKEVFKAIDLGVDGIAVPLYVLRKICPFLKGIPMSIATSSDFPNGYGDRKLRVHETLTALKSGANKIDLVASPFFIKDERYLDLLEDLKTHKRACDDHGAELRVIINHGLYPLKKSIGIAHVIEDSGAKFVIPASGFHNDDIYDNLLAAASIESKTGLMAISNGYIWLEKQYKAAIESGIFGLRVYNFHLL
jgi:deoxyribose-phosphate aldolase